MTTAWMLNALGLFVTTAGALLIFLYLSHGPRFVERFQTPEDKQAYQRHHAQLMIGVGLLAAWLLVQDLALILL